MNRAAPAVLASNCGCARPHLAARLLYHCRQQLQLGRLCMAMMQFLRPSVQWLSSEASAGLAEFELLQFYYAAAVVLICHV